MDDIIKMLQQLTLIDPSEFSDCYKSEVRIIYQVLLTDIISKRCTVGSSFAIFDFYILEKNSCINLITCDVLQLADRLEILSFIHFKDSTYEEVVNIEYPDSVIFDYYQRINF